MPQISYLTLTLITLGIYFMWMDVALYINLQQIPPLQPDLKPIPMNYSDYSFSPFYPITIKLLVQGPTIHYIDEPLAYWTLAYTNIENIMSANTASIIGMFFALASAKLILSDSLRVRQLGVLLFKIRDYFDSVDGCLARSKLNQVKMEPMPGTLGYVLDGVCDALGNAFVFIAIFLFIYR